MALNQMFRSGLQPLKAAYIAALAWIFTYAPLLYAGAGASTEGAISTTDSTPITTATADPTSTNVPDLSTMLANFSTSVPQLMQLVTATAYVMGMWFIYKAVLGLKAFGEQRSMMSSHQELKGPLVMFLTGTCLLYLPSAVQSGLTTFWTDPNPYGYVSETTDQWSTMYQDAFMVVQLIGTIAFIRGLLVLSSMGGQSSQPGTFGKGMTFIIAGVMCINLNDFLNAINNTLGVSSLITG